jgi:phage tail protein X
MPGLPLNTFKNITKVPVEQGTPDPVDYIDYKVYSAPLGVTSIVLTAQVANVGTSDAAVTLIHRKGRSPNLGQFTYIVNEIMVPPNDARILLGGKLILESLDTLLIYSNTDPGSVPLHFIASVLETANQ